MMLKAFLSPGDQRQDVGRKGRGAEEDAGDVGQDAGADEAAEQHKPGGLQ